MSDKSCYIGQQVVVSVGVGSHYECAALPTELSRLPNEISYLDVASSRPSSDESGRKVVKRHRGCAKVATQLPKQGV